MAGGLEIMNKSISISSYVFGSILCVPLTVFTFPLVMDLVKEKEKEYGVAPNFFKRCVIIVCTLWMMGVAVAHSWFNNKEMEESCKDVVDDLCSKDDKPKPWVDNIK